MRAKFGDGERTPPDAVRIGPLGDAEGIHFDFGCHHGVAQHARCPSRRPLGGHRGHDTQTRLVRGLFQLYFQHGANIGDHAVLVDAARAAGLDAPVIESLLTADADREAVTDEVVTASRMGITGVPCFLLESKYAVIGAQDTATMADAISQVAAAKARGELETAPS